MQSKKHYYLWLYVGEHSRQYLMFSLTGSITMRLAKDNLFQVSSFNKGNLVHYISQPIWIPAESLQDNNVHIFTHIKCI